MGNLTLNGQTVLTQVGTNRPEFGAGVPSGVIVQVKHNYFSTYWNPGTVTSGTETAIGLSLSFTPKFNTSEILVSVDLDGLVNEGDNYYSSFRLYRDDTLLRDFGYPWMWNSVDNANNPTMSCKFIDTPGTTDTFIYDIRHYQWNGSSAPDVNRDSRGMSTIVAMEITA